MQYVAAYLCAAAAFAVLDFFWLSYAGPRLYQPIIGELLAPQVSLPPAIAFYLIYVAGIVFLAVVPGLRDGSALRAAVCGAVLGGVAYAAYDLTNQATLRIWSLKITLADISWGVFVTAIAALAGFWGARTAARLFSGS